MDVALFQRGELLRQREFAQFEPNARVARRELAQRQRQHRVDARRHESDRQSTRLAAAGGARRFNCVRSAGEHDPRLIEECPSGLRQRNAPPVAHEQLHVEFVFEVADRDRQRRLRDRESTGRPTEVQFLGEHDEVTQRSQFHGFFIARLLSVISNVNHGKPKNILDAHFAQA